jgi:hypothetical protein
VAIGKWLEQQNILPRPKTSGPMLSSPAAGISNGFFGPSSHADGDAGSLLGSGSLALGYGGQPGGPRQAGATSRYPPTEWEVTGVLDSGRARPLAEDSEDEQDGSGPITGELGYFCARRVPKQQPCCCFWPALMPACRARRHAGAAAAPCCARFRSWNGSTHQPLCCNQVHGWL